ncbi:hypothetical protein [Mucilaginibacter antarcticus]|uniref:hypothetical protein n=1 Tax=Mucilaginibacter antarcticus TaxID=1855725 RepID=UPI00362B3458
MKFHQYLLALLMLLSCMNNDTIAQQKAKVNALTPLDYVDPTIGGSGIVLQPTRPLVHLPNSMLRVFPMKQDELDDQVMFFPLNVVSHRVEYAFSFCR